MATAKAVDRYRPPHPGLHGLTDMSRGTIAVPVRGSAEAIADGIPSFRDGGFTHVEVLIWPPTLTALEAMAPVLESLDAY